MFKRLKKLEDKIDIKQLRDKVDIYSLVIPHEIEFQVEKLNKKIAELNHSLNVIFEVFAQKGYLLEVSNEPHDLEITDDNCNTKKYKVNRKK